MLKKSTRSKSSTQEEPGFAKILSVICIAKTELAPCQSVNRNLTSEHLVFDDGHRGSGNVVSGAH